MQPKLTLCGEKNIWKGCEKMNLKQNQAERVLAYMASHGSITQLEALTEISVMRLASRISDLRKLGYPIESEMVTVRNRYGENCRVKRYSLSGV